LFLLSEVEGFIIGKRKGKEKDRFLLVVEMTEKIIISYL